MLAQKDLAKLRVLDLAVQCLVRQLSVEQRKQFHTELSREVGALLDEIKQEVEEEELARGPTFQRTVLGDMRPPFRTPAEIDTERTGLEESLESLIRKTS